MRQFIRICIDRSIIRLENSDLRTQPTSLDSLLGVGWPPDGRTVRIVARAAAHVLSLHVEGDLEYRLSGRVRRDRPVRIRALCVPVPHWPCARLSFKRCSYPHSSGMITFRDRFRLFLTVLTLDLRSASSENSPGIFIMRRLGWAGLWVCRRMRDVSSWWRRPWRWRSAWPFQERLAHGPPRPARLPRRLSRPPRPIRSPHAGPADWPVHSRPGRRS